MKVTISPAPFDAAGDYTIAVVGGTPPYTFLPLPEPPNPPGVTIVVDGDTARIQVPPDTASGTQVQVDVTDSSQPPQTAPTANAVA